MHGATSISRRWSRSGAGACRLPRLDALQPGANLDVVLHRFGLDPHRRITRAELNLAWQPA